MKARGIVLLTLGACSTPTSPTDDAGGRVQGTCTLTVSGAFVHSQRCFTYSEERGTFGVDSYVGDGDLVAFVNCDFNSLSPGDYPQPPAICRAYLSPITATPIFVEVEGGASIHLDDVGPTIGMDNLSGHAVATLADKYGDAGTVTINAVFTRAPRPR